MKSIIAFVAGVALGSLVTFTIVKKKYEQIAQEEIDSVKERFSKRSNHCDDNVEFKVKCDENISNDKNVYDKIINNNKYSDRGHRTSIKTPNESEKKEVDVEEPYVISPDEFGELDDYERISLIYYADRVLTDDDDEVIDNAEEVVGTDFASHFGEYEDHYVYIRNDKFKCDYEISEDYREYSKVNNITIHGGYSS